MTEPVVTEQEPCLCHTDFTCLATEHVQPVETPVEPAHVELAQYEGANIVGHEMVLPRITLDVDTGYKRGTILRLAVEVRVGGASYTETKDGDVIRTAKGAFNDVSVVTSYDPGAARENVGGSASGSVVHDIDPDDVEALAALGVDFSTTAETWPGGVAEAAKAGDL